MHVRPLLWAIVWVVGLGAVVLGLSNTASAQDKLLGFRGGFVLSGDGELEFEQGGTSANLDYEEDTNFGLNGYLLFPIGRNLTLGPSLWYIPEYELDIELLGNTVAVSGDDLSMLNANALLEYALPLGSVDGFLYAEAGLAMIFPADDDDDDDAFVGLNLGGGFGLQFPISGNVVFRSDLMLSLYQASRESNNVDVTFAGTRIMLNFGVAFGI